jgi:methyl coenzyme M reductase beta subunit
MVVAAVTRAEELAEYMTTVSKGGGHPIMVVIPRELASELVADAEALAEAAEAFVNAYYNDRPSVEESAMENLRAVLARYRGEKPPALRYGGGK